jgi:hypothetical protein
MRDRANQRVPRSVLPGTRVNSDTPLIPRFRIEKWTTSLADLPRTSTLATACARFSSAAAHSPKGILDQGISDALAVISRPRPAVSSSPRERVLP